LIGVAVVAASLSGCGLAQDVARQAGLPDSVFQALGFADHHAAAAAAPASVVAVPSPKPEARRSHRRKHHAKGHADDKAAAATSPAELGTSEAKSADAAQGFTDHVPPPVVATSDGKADATQDGASPAPAPAQAAADATPHADQRAAASPLPPVPSRVSRRKVEEKVYAAIQQCKELHRQGGLGSFQQTAECMGPRIWAAWHDANYPYMDLIGLYVSALERDAARLDRHEITEAEFEQEMTRMQNRIASEEQRRDLPAAQLTNISGTGGLAPTE
jgi:hypothetical protein